METLENTPRELVAIKTLHHLIDTPIPTIRRWIYKGEIPFIKLPTGSIRFEISAVRRWWRKGAAEPVANRLLKV